MQILDNKFKSTYIEFHILQSFPVTCLNRDDVGAPKTAIIGGTTRSRVSSQCWKRQVRLSMHDLGIIPGVRTKLIKSLIEKECMKQGASEEQAFKCGEKIENIFIKKSDKKNKTDDEENNNNQKSDTLLFLSPSEITKIVLSFAENNFDPDKVITQKDIKKQPKEIENIIGKPNFAIDGLDIALFGRMVAQAASMDVEAAASFSHAISTHKVVNELDFFTALDDCSDEQGSAHMGSLEFNSATYYRYISLNLGQLYENLAGQNILEAIEIFIKALFMAVPSARQSTQSGASSWEYARIFLRKGQRLQIPFETAVKVEDGGYLEPSIKTMNKYLDEKKKLFGSFFNEIKDVSFGRNESDNIDTLINILKEEIRKIS